jgi:hypothetical protein
VWRDLTGAHVTAAGGTIEACINAVYDYPTLSDLYKNAAYDGPGKWNELQEGRSS